MFSAVGQVTLVIQYFRCLLFDVLNVDKSTIPFALVAAVMLLFLPCFAEVAQPCFADSLRVYVLTCQEKQTACAAV